MNMDSILNDYREIKECSYKGEQYSVRDNGAVLRHARYGNRFRTGTSNCGFRFSWRTSHTSAYC